MMKMRLIVLVTLTSLDLGSILPAPEGKRSGTPGELEYWDWDDGQEKVFGDTEPTVELEEKQFEIEIGLESITDPADKERRQKALKKAEKAERINEWSDLPEDEFEKEKAGDVENFARGLLEPELKPVDARSERYFASLLLRRDAVPASYSAVDAGLVSSVKNQKQCGSCVAFGLHLDIIVTVLIVIFNISNISIVIIL